MKTNKILIFFLIFLCIKITFLPLNIEHANNTNQYDLSLYKMSGMNLLNNSYLVTNNDALMFPLLYPFLSVIGNNIIANDNIRLTLINFIFSVLTFIPILFIFRKFFNDKNSIIYTYIVCLLNPLMIYYFIGFPITLSILLLCILFYFLIEYNNNCYTFLYILLCTKFIFYTLCLPILIIGYIKYKTKISIFLLITFLFMPYVFTFFRNLNFNSLGNKLPYASYALNYMHIDTSFFNISGMFLICLMFIVPYFIVCIFKKLNNIDYIILFYLIVCFCMFIFTGTYINKELNWRYLSYFTPICIIFTIIKLKSNTRLLKKTITF